jgi:hypothetical protein
MRSQGFTGRDQLINRLALQVGDRAAAIRILQRRGHLMADGKTFTHEGAKRNAMDAKERAIDRASKASHRPASEFHYNARTNYASRLRDGR